MLTAENALQDINLRLFQLRSHNTGDIHERGSCQKMLQKCACHKSAKT